MPARHATETRRDRDDVPAGEAGDRTLDDRLRNLCVEVARRELATALDGDDGLTPAQRRTVARMAGRIAADILSPARDAVAADDSPPPEAVERLFAASPEHVRDRR